MWTLMWYLVMMNPKAGLLALYTVCVWFFFLKSWPKNAALLHLIQPQCLSVRKEKGCGQLLSELPNSSPHKETLWSRAFSGNAIFLTWLCKALALMLWNLFSPHFDLFHLIILLNAHKWQHVGTSTPFSISILFTIYIPVPLSLHLRIVNFLLPITFLTCRTFKHQEFFPGFYLLFLYCGSWEFLQYLSVIADRGIACFHWFVQGILDTYNLPERLNIVYLSVHHSCTWL